MKPAENDVLTVASASFTTQGNYTMAFADDNGPDDNSGNSDNQPNKKGGGKDSKGYISVLLFGLAFIVIVVLMLYYFVFRNVNSTVTYTENDIVYNVDTDHDGKADLTSDGYPDFSKLSDSGLVNGSFTIGDTTGTSKAIVMAGGTTASDAPQPGSLATLLINGSSNKVTLTVTQGYDNQSVYTLTGTYVETKNSRDITHNFQAVLHSEYYANYLNPILKYTQVQDTAGAFSIYYSTKTFAFAQESANSVSSWLVPLIFGILILAFIIYFVNRMYKSMGAASGPGAMSGFVDGIARKETGSKVRFADVAGCDEAKAELVEMVDYFHSTDKYTRLGAKLPHGVLLIGPPGTGKTLLAKAVAGEANVPFYSISGSDFVEMYVGVGASRVRSLFKTAKQNAPCLIFIDEIDAVGRQRGAGLGGGNDEREQTLNELLVEMDGFEDNSGIIVMAATNRSDVLDPALTRPGRFDRTITVDLPDREGRSAILKVHSRNKKLAPDISFDSIASRTVGFSGADLANIMNEAAILAVRANRSMITTADIDEAIDRAIAGPAKKSHLEEHEKEQVAYHEAGHAVIGIFLPYSDVVQKITIIPRGRTGGHVLMTPAQDHFLLTKNQMIARITGYLGGRTSEEIFFGDVSTGASNDIEVATELARSMVTQYGMSELGPIQYEKPGGSVFLGRDYNSTQANYSTQIAFEIDKAVRQIIDECHEKARQLLSDHKEDVELIAKTLMAKETITADQIDYLLKNRKLPEENDHIMTSASGSVPKNAKGIVLYPGYERYYTTIDKILESNPSRLVIVVPEGLSMTEDNFKKACVNGVKDPSHIGMMFVDESQSRSIALSIETFATHLEAYAGVPVLLIKTTNESVLHLRSIFTPKVTDQSKAS
jgi:cell division protease FtsH